MGSRSLTEGSLGMTMAPHDPLVDEAIEAYFEPFVQSCQLVPGQDARCSQRPGRAVFPGTPVQLLTHPPAVNEILARGLQIQRFLRDDS